MSNQRLFLKDYYLQPDQHYSAIFNHISTHKGIPAALLTNLTLTDQNGNVIRINRYDLNTRSKDEISDHVWIDLNSNWFKLKTELFYGDQIEFDAHIEKYPIARDDVLKKRNEIWENTVLENNNLKQMWCSQRNLYHGQIRQQKYSQIQAQIKNNVAVARQRQKQIPLVDYGLTDIKNIHILKLMPLLKYRSFKRTKYNEAYKTYGHKYNIWLSKRTQQYIRLLKLKKKIE
jgi:hypothetical protein